MFSAPIQPMAPGYPVDPSRKDALDWVSRQPVDESYLVGMYS